MIIISYHKTLYYIKDRIGKKLCEYYKNKPYGVLLDDKEFGFFTKKEADKVLEDIKSHIEKYPLPCKGEFKYKIFEFPET